MIGYLHVDKSFLNLPISLLSLIPILHLHHSFVFLTNVSIFNTTLRPFFDLY
jgi:hypothetical protein